MSSQDATEAPFRPRLTSTERQRLILFAAVAAVVLFLCWRARASLTPFLVGLLMAYVLLPLVTRVQRRLPESMHRRGHARLVAVLVVYVAAFAVVAVAVMALVPTVIEQAVEVIASAPATLTRAERAFVETVANYQATLQGVLGPERYDALVEMVRSATGTEAAGRAASTLVDFLKSVAVSFTRTIGSTVSTILGFLVIPIWMIYVMTDAERLQVGAKGLVPAGLRGDAHALVTIVDTVLAAYIRGQLFIAIALGTLAALALALLGVPYALLLGVATGLLGFIPFLGAIIAAVLAFVVALTDSTATAVKALVAYIAVQQVDNFFITPRTQSGAVSLHPAVIMVVLVLGQALVGPVGLLLAVPVTAITRDILHYIYLRLGAEGSLPHVALATVGYELPPELAALAPPDASLAVGAG